MTKLTLDEFLEKHDVAGRYLLSSNPHGHVFGKIGKVRAEGDCVVFYLEWIYNDLGDWLELPTSDRRIMVRSTVPAWKHGEDIFFLTNETEIVHILPTSIFTAPKVRRRIVEFPRRTKKEIRNG